MRKIYVFLCFLFCSLPIFSQSYLGLVNNNYGAFNSVLFNPAMGNKTMVSLHLVTFDFNAYNNYLGFNDFHLIKAIKDTGYFNGSTGWDFNKQTVERINGNEKYATLTLDLIGPAIMVGYDRYQLGYYWNRVRFGIQMSGVEEKLVRNLYHIADTKATDVSNLRFSDNKFLVAMNAWNESGFTGAYAIKDDKDQMLRVGLTVKMLNGLAAAYIINRGTTFYFYKQQKDLDSSLYANYDLEGGMTNEFSYDPNYSDRLDTFTQDHFKNIKVDPKLVSDNIIKKQKRLGSGLGADIGAVYEKREGRKSKYRYRVGISLVDIGKVKYSNTKYTYVTHYTAVQKEVVFPKKIQGNNTLQKDTNIAHRAGAAPGKFEAFNMALPTCLNISFDYRVIDHFYVNGTLIQSVRSKYKIGTRVFSSFSISPRFESRWVSATIPVVLNDDYKNLNVGICLSVLNCIYVGSDNIGGAFGLGTISGLDIYAGASINLYKHKKKKKEKVEKVEKVKVKDTDKDGVPDDVDECPDVPGLPSLKGCPDKDLDGVPDKDDKCPDIPGKLNGCPDTDGDGIADKDDRCPTVAGTVATKGCPDRDGDGVADLDDECPDVKGPVALKGCPDTDGDGFPDKDDDCPTIPGKIKGCPDKDGDGVADKDDKCPEIPGPVAMKGCPDSDSDGVNDADDQCPLVKGTIANFGCPEKEKDVVKVEKVDLNADDKKTLEEAFKNLEFASAKSEIKDSSKIDLGKIVDIMNRNPTYRLLIVGHTDNAGSAAFNKTLSLNRANAVKAYMVSKGIAASRFITKGYGPDRPIADNATPEGKQRNRRVEMTIVK